MKPATEAKLLVAAIGAATFVIGGALGPSGLSHAFNSAAEFAQFALTGATTVLAAGACAIGGSKLLTRGMEGLGSIVPGIVGMVFGFAVGAGVGNLAGQEMASHIGHQENAAHVISVAPEQKLKAPEIPSIQPEIF